MLGPKQKAQSALFYDFSIEDHVPHDHVLRQLTASLTYPVFANTCRGFIARLTALPLPGNAL